MKISSVRIWTLSAVVFYTAVIAKLILFKGSLFFRVVPTSRHYKKHVSSGTYSEYNLIPFRTIKLFLSDGVSTTAAFYNLAGNIILFIPFGLLLSYSLLNRASFAAIFLATFLLSFLFELYQHFTHIGKGDIDDIILNTLGGIVGYWIFLLLQKNWPLTRKLAPL